MLDSAAIGDVDYTASSLLTRAITHLHQRHIQFVMTSVLTPVRQQLEHYGISGAAGRTPTSTRGRGPRGIPRRRARPDPPSPLQPDPPAADQPAGTTWPDALPNSIREPSGPGAEPDSVTVSPSAR